MNLFLEFPPVSTEEWEAAVRADLKGRDPSSLGKILYRAEDVAGLDFGDQPWPSRPWEIWAEVSDLAGARRALDRGAEGLVVDHPTQDWSPLLQGIHLHTAAELGDWASDLRGTIETDTVSGALPGFRKAVAIPHDLPIATQVELCRQEAHFLREVGSRLGIADETLRTHPMAHVLKTAAQISAADLVVPVGPSYFQEIAKFRAIRRLCPYSRIIARTSRWHATAYDPHVNLLRGTTGAMAAIIGGCDALIVGPFTEARGFADDMAERLALNTQLLLRDESYFGQVADPAAGSWYIESVTAELLKGGTTGTSSNAFIGVNRYPNPGETSPETITPGRAMTALEQCRLRSERAPRRPTVRLLRGTDAKMARARAAFSRDFFIAGGFEVVEAENADLTVLCDADVNYQANRQWPVLAAGSDFGRHSDPAATIAAWQNRLGI